MSNQKKGADGEGAAANEKGPYGSDELVRQNALGPEALGLECHVLLGLGVEGGVLDQRVHKHPDVVLHLQHRGEDSSVSSQHLELKIYKVSRSPTWKGLTVTPALFFFFTTSISLDTIWSTT